jgi:hypothetical protein
MSRFPGGWALRRAVTLMLTGALAATVVGAVPTSAAGPRDHFKATIPDNWQGEDDNLWTPQDYEDAAAAEPEPDGTILFSRCRRDPFQATDTYAPFSGDAIVGDTSFQYASGESCFNPQNEQNIVVNPTNPKNIVTSANEYRDQGVGVYVTKDGGATWTNVFPKGFTVANGGKGVFKSFTDAGDPVLAFGKDGTLYLAEIVFVRVTNPNNTGVAVARSTDGGLTWGAPSLVTYQATRDVFNDKEWIGVGPNGEVYVTWTRFLQGPRGLGYLGSPIYLSRSRDGGKSWSARSLVSDAAHPYNQGSQVLVGNDGAVVVAYEGSSPATNFATDALVVARSTDGGKTFANREIARIYDDLDCYPTNEDGRQSLSYEAFRINSYPSMAYDPSNGTWAITWADNQGSGTCGQGGATWGGGATSNQVKLITSADGKAWGAERTITTDAPDKVYPAVGANGGRIVVGYFTRAYSPVPTATDRSCGLQFLDSVTGAVVNPDDPAELAAPVCLDWAMKSSNDGFAAETRLSTQSSNPYLQFAGSFIGDYEGVAVDASGKAALVWTDDRGNPGVTTPNQDAVVATGR